jgi:hypothetical protein
MILRAKTREMCAGTLVWFLVFVNVLPAFLLIMAVRINSSHCDMGLYIGG